MEQTRIISPGGGQDAFGLAAPGGVDSGRTQMGGPGGLTLEVLTGNRYALATRHGRDHVLIRGAASGMAAGRRLPLNLCLVIDRSGSMEGEPLEYVKRACHHVVDLLDPSDVLSIVTFETAVDVVMPARRVINRQLIKEHINRIQPGNTTNLYDGLVAGGQQVSSVPAGGYVNRIILLTDGEPTAGIRDFQSIVSGAKDLQSRGISVTALGFGPEYNEELLAGMARRSGGNYYYISRPDLIPEVFRTELEQLLTITAKNLRLRLITARWVQVRQVYGQQPVFGNRTVEIALPDLERGTAVSALVEMEFGPRPAGTYRVARAELLYDDCVTGAVGLSLAQDAVFEFTNDPGLLAAGVNPLVQQELEVARASRSLERTMMGIKTQQITSAVALAELQRTQMLLTAQGRTEEAAEVAQAIQAMRQGSGDVEKTLIGAIVDLDQGKRKT
ncbi:MAG: VWA domain-containing protein [Armatimonadetes bacterium]|nr:VWA domain-containing protein [Armatimonadota bacterium]